MGINQSKVIFLTAVVLCAYGASAHAQSSVNISGLLETGVRYSTNQNAAGNSKFSVADGEIDPSRIAFSGTEDLGGNLKAIFMLEAGFQVANGSSVNGSIGDYSDPSSLSRLFGRNTYVGLQGDFGKLTVGRQYTTAYIATWGFDPIYGGGLVVYAPYYGFVGLRQDNMLRYEKTVGEFVFNGHYVFGGQPGSTTRGSSYGVGATYAHGGIGLSAAYQEENNDSTTIVPAYTSKKKTAVIGGSYVFGDAKATLGYIHTSFEGIAQKDNVLVASLSYATSTPWTFKVVGYHVKQSAADGTNTMLVGIADYALSKRTSLYLEADYNKYANALLPFGAGGPDNQSGVTAGIKHTF